MRLCFVNKKNLTTCPCSTVARWRKQAEQRSVLLHQAGRQTNNADTYLSIIISRTGVARDTVNLLPQRSLFAFVYFPAGMNQTVSICHYSSPGIPPPPVYGWKTSEHVDVSYLRVVVPHPMFTRHLIRICRDLGGYTDALCVVMGELDTGTPGRVPPSLTPNNMSKGVSLRSALLPTSCPPPPNTYLPAI